VGDILAVCFAAVTYHELFKLAARDAIATLQAHKPYHTLLHPAAPYYTLPHPIAPCCTLPHPTTPYYTRFHPIPPIPPDHT
jgi:hypothetical protein